MNETGYIQSVNRHVNWEYYWKINDMYQGGVVDCFYEGTEHELWIEYKYISSKKFPKRDTTLIDLKKEKDFLSRNQQMWIERRHNFKNDAWVIVGSEHGGVIFRGLGWKIPITAPDFKARALPQKAVAAQIQAFIDGHE